MSGTKRGSIWYSTPAINRIRKVTHLTLSKGARLELDRLAGLHGWSKSAVVEALIHAGAELLGAPKEEDEGED